MSPPTSSQTTHAHTVVTVSSVRPRGLRGATRPQAPWALRPGPSHAPGPGGCATGGRSSGDAKHRAARHRIGAPGLQRGTPTWPPHCCPQRVQARATGGRRVQGDAVPALMKRSQWNRLPRHASNPRLVSPGPDAATGRRATAWSA